VMFVRTAQEVQCAAVAACRCVVLLLQLVCALVLLVCGPEFELFEACNFGCGSEGVGPTKICC
jgi:hypothetical protein